jgi:hopanoid biosynthesis associated RND transporter like protein HpnN
MTTFFDRRIGDVVARVVRASALRHHTVLAAVVLVTPLLGLHTARHLGVNAEIASLFADELPYRVLDREFDREFPVLYENLVVVVDAATNEQAEEAAKRVARGMREEGSPFRHVFHPGSGFFETHGLLYADLADLETLADRLARAQPYLAGLAADLSLSGFARLLARGSTAALRDPVEGDELAAMLDRFSAALEAQDRGEPFVVSWSGILAPSDNDASSRRQIVTAQPILDLSAVLAAKEPIEFVRSLAGDIQREIPGARIRISGDMALAYEEMSILQRQVAWASLASFCIVAATMVLAFRSVRLVFLASLNMLVGLVWTMFFATVAIGHLNVISVAFAVLFIGLSDDYGIHFCMRYHELRRQRRGHLDALTSTARDVGVAIGVCAVTTAIGFYAFVPTEFRGVAELGLIAGTGMFINVVLCVTLLPALVTLAMGRTTPPPAPVDHASSTHRPALPLRRPGLVAAVAACFACAAALALPHVRFEADPLDVRDPSAESVQTFRELVRDAEGSPWNVSVIVDTGEEAATLAVALRELPAVSMVVTLDDFVPEDQDRKRAVLDDIKLFLAPGGRIMTSRFPSVVGEEIAALDDLRTAVTAVADGAVSDGLATSAGRLAERLQRIVTLAPDSPATRERLAVLDESVLSTLPRQLERLDAALHADVVTRESLPHELVERMVSVEGRHRIEVAPSEDLADDDALERFVAAVRSIAPGATGGAISVYESERAVVAAFRKAFVFAATAIALLLVCIWRSAADAALVMTPLALAAAFTTAIAVGLGVTFNYANVIVLPLLFGLGVNSGIHLVERWRLNEAELDRLLETSTAKAVVYSSLNTVGSFGTLGFTTHRGMASMGQLLALGVSLTVVCNLVILPALIALRSRRRLRRERATG